MRVLKLASLCAVVIYFLHWAHYSLLAFTNPVRQLAQKRWLQGCRVTGINIIYRQIEHVIWSFRVLSIWSESFCSFFFYSSIFFIYSSFFFYTYFIISYSFLLSSASIDFWRWSSTSCDLAFLKDYSSIVYPSAASAATLLWCNSHI